MKKVLILSSSPRRGGNSDTLCNRFMAGAQEKGHNVEKITLADKNIGYCTVAAYAVCTANRARKKMTPPVLSKK